MIKGLKMNSNQKKITGIVTAVLTLAGGAAGYNHFSTPDYLAESAVIKQQVGDLKRKVDQLDQTVGGLQSSIDRANLEQLAQKLDELSKEIVDVKVAIARRQ